MPKESEWHREVRGKIERHLKNKNIKFKSSHSGVKVPLFIDFSDTSRSNQLSDADFIIIKNKTIKFIIEIEKGAPTPKKLMGIITAANLSTAYKRQEEKFKIQNAKLFIVTGDKETNKMNKPKSKKLEQYHNIKKHLKLTKGSLVGFDILTLMGKKDLEKIYSEIDSIIKVPLRKEDKMP